ncbi:hypothetical protein FOXG_21772 [Fusarium oxysporum f. sp. lycopersici 4287]|uniref:Uncharacterized protein n=1 Tax=Fusarium oxysporum f. sp. lycopersici (strain 4287 / CBS 123668 / FGSC 9935 / NRRL 34936) TaxID=426428 RepID=A0A0J9W1N8_FUSO4|nr:hypothetical protein FOXG_21772 [Fusarium oxysporum f. sp. lycopersici 4287]KNB16725.1 hypothetical protein FOXG_21772 [Fusarium oxysporum f. sp. lycopersici 4287]
MRSSSCHLLTERLKDILCLKWANHCLILPVNYRGQNLSRVINAHGEAPAGLPQRRRWGLSVLLLVWPSRLRRMGLKTSATNGVINLVQLSHRQYGMHSIARVSLGWH